MGEGLVGSSPRHQPIPGTLPAPREPSGGKEVQGRSSPENTVRAGEGRGMCSGGPPALEDSYGPPLLSRIGQGRGHGAVHSTGERVGPGRRAGARAAHTPSALLPGHLFAFNTIQRGKNGGRGQKKRKNPTAKTLYKKTPPAELSNSEPMVGGGGRVAQPAGHWLAIA